MNSIIRITLSRRDVNNQKRTRRNANLSGVKELREGDVKERGDGADV